MPATLASINHARTIGHPDPAQVEAVLQDTWGHLAPKEAEIYTGHVLFTYGCFGDITVIDWELVNGLKQRLDSSPWFYADLNEFVAGEVEKKGHFYGGIWRWEGNFKRLKNGKSRWSGQTRPMRLQFRFGKR